MQEDNQQVFFQQIPKFDLEEGVWKSSTARAYLPAANQLHKIKIHSEIHCRKNRIE